MKKHFFVYIVFIFLSCSMHSKKEQELKNEKDSTSRIDTFSFDRSTQDVVGRFTKSPELRNILNKRIRDNLQKARVENKRYYPESIVIGHLEEDTIVGMFDGIHLDTLYITCEECGCKEIPFCIHGERRECFKYYMVSKSGRFPKVRLSADQFLPPRIVNEGDLDGNGSCDVGYMYTWGTSQWRCYQILTWQKKQWRSLIGPGEYLATTLAFRLSGYEIAEPGKEKGTVLIHFLPDGLNQEVHDTIVRATYIRIDNI